MIGVLWLMPAVAEYRKFAKKIHLLFFCPEKLAIFAISGIITTNLGKTATHTKVAGREKTDTSLQNMPFSLTGEGHFFWFGFLPVIIKNTKYNQ
jgi:hypothetical protein